LLSRTISTVPQLWREWTVGIGKDLSVQGLKALYGVRWRRKHSDKTMYDRRKVIIDEIRRQEPGGISVGSVAPRRYIYPTNKFVRFCGVS
jgi:Transcriptional activator of glycolytic enzymes